MSVYFEIILKIEVYFDVYTITQQYNTQNIDWVNFSIVVIKYYVTIILYDQACNQKI